jgi:hypothetical protein
MYIRKGDDIKYDKTIPTRWNIYNSICLFATFSR